MTNMVLDVICLLLYISTLSFHSLFVRIKHYIQNDRYSNIISQIQKNFVIGAKNISFLPYFDTLLLSLIWYVCICTSISVGEDVTSHCCYGSSGKCCGRYGCWATSSSHKTTMNCSNLSPFPCCSQSNIFYIYALCLLDT